MASESVAISDETTIDVTRRPASEDGRRRLLGGGDLAAAATKPPVLMIHGFLDSRRTWDEAIEGMPSDRDVFAMTLRGWGDSSKNGPFTIDSYATDVVKLLDALTIEAAVLVGHSMGTLVATAVAARSPGRVAGIVLCGAVDTVDPGEELAPAMAADGMGTLAELFANALGGESAEVYPPELDDKGLTDAARQGLCGFQDSEPGSKTMVETFKAAPAAIRGCWDDMFAENHAAELGSISAPVMICWGTEDFVFPRPVQDRVRNAFPNSTAFEKPVYFEVPGATHDAIIKKPLTALGIASWLETL
jgi:non-heme chloroperoxidase